MFPLQQPQFDGWFLEGSQDAPVQAKCSIGAAVSRGHVLRHELPGYLFLTDGRGRVSFDAAIKDGLIDQAAADYIASQEGCHYASAPVGIPHPAEKAFRPGTLEEFEGTPVGAFVAALQAWRMSPGVDEQVKVAKTFQAALKRK